MSIRAQDGGNRRQSNQHYRVQLRKKIHIYSEPSEVSSLYVFFPSNILVETDLSFRNFQGHCVRVLKPRYPSVLTGISTITLIDSEVCDIVWPRIKFITFIIT